MEVLDQEDDGGDPGQALEDAEHELEEPDLGEAFVRGRRDPGVAGSIGGGPGRSGTHLGHEARELVPVRTEQGREPARVRVTDQSAESFDERRIGQTAGRQGEAAARQHSASVRGDARRERVDQARLADPGFAGDEDGPGLAPGGAH